ncbi:hypothetical protein QUF80_08325 [Desulfococcaceae bacterium HSG8]|nr:hypothetical protein [Desulfococcaceae bacterium HSG8]
MSGPAKFSETSEVLAEEVPDDHQTSEVLLSPGLRSFRKPRRSRLKRFRAITIPPRFCYHRACEVFGNLGGLG